jgi:hypothetical protein
LFKDFLVNQRAWRHGLVLPIFVPADLLNIRAFLAAGQLQEAAAELLKLSSLGSNSAAALLAYLCLRDENLCGADRAAAAERCRESASRRNGFAQFVLAWSEHKKGNTKQFYYWLHQSAKQRFSPAMGDLGRIYISPPNKDQRHPKLSKRFFFLAIRNGHSLSIATFMHGCWRGAFGQGFRLIGIPGYPLSLLFLWLLMRLFPFALSVFAYPTGSNRPLFNIANKP